MVYIPKDPTRNDREKRSKYRNKKVSAGGFTFDSIIERDRWFYLQDAARTGAIRNLRRQVKFDLGVCKYIADFVYSIPTDIDPSCWRNIIEDVKGGYKLPADFRIKEKMMANRGTPITIVKSPTAKIGA